MARNESDREDLMAEAVSLVQRVEFQCPARPGPSIIGINQLQWLSVYRDQDTMYRFDEQGRLRRAFIDGTLYRTTGQTLAAMVRSRSGTSDEAHSSAESLLLRRDLGLDELAAFRVQMTQDLSELAVGLSAGTILRQHPHESNDLVPLLLQRIQQVLQSPDFLAPAIVRR